ncbi:MAG: histidine-type phosphatase [Prevotella sp.]|nr:histidine-type phosphatase [Bacteroides sp.]MCM1366093.1 histidine-type phosphatase [Prevotella sp.]MCM1436578.1 histidine-type phosphatase [Prevotella sp.]
MIREIIISTILLFSATSILGQTTKDEVTSDLNKAGGVYYAYPVNESLNTPAPKGYKPFYISHYGRHGSRYLISDNDYSWVANLLHKAEKEDALTPLGVDVMHRLDSLMIETAGRGGDLSPLGVRQHRGIAERMYKAYPEVFKGETEISARSTIVVRCVLSMDAFCERLKELNPKLRTTRESSNRYMNYLNYHSDESNAYTSKEWKEQYRKFERKLMKPERLVNSLFSDQNFIETEVMPDDLMWALYFIAVGMQDVETPLSFYDIFTPDELYDMWQLFNYRFYVCDSNFAGNRGLLLDNAKPLLRNIIESADDAISKKEPSVTLRFGHDGNLIPLTGILRLKNCYNSVSRPEEFPSAFADFKIAPMAGNVQMIFFRNEKNPDDVLVKFMLNERETSIPVETNTWPFYRWNDVKHYYETEILP